jgi:hypothetical protein
MISVVIATSGDDDERLATTLASLVPGAADGTVREVIVVGGGEGTRTIADATGCVLVAETGPLGARLAAGAAAARRGEWLLFLEPGVALDPRWEAEVSGFIERLTRSGQAGTVAAVFRYALDDVTATARAGEAAAALSGWITGLPRPSQGLLIAREHYRRIGGHRPVAALADADLALRVGRMRLVRLRSRAAMVTPADAPHVRGRLAGLRRGLSRGLAALRVPVGLLERLHG